MSDHLTPSPHSHIGRRCLFYLKHGGGVAVAIVRKGGRIIQEESDKIIAKTGIVSVGSAVSQAYEMKWNRTERFRYYYST